MQTSQREYSLESLTKIILLLKQCSISFQGLREMLQISQKFGSNTAASIAEDKAVQTDIEPTTISPIPSTIDTPTMTAIEAPKDDTTTEAQEC